MTRAPGALRRRVGRLVVVGCALGLVAVATAAFGATRYDPRLRFRTISTPRFDIHFHQGLDSAAWRLSRLVEGAASAVDAAVGPPIGRVQVILVDQHDLSNGWATPLPYNTIEISAAAPGAESSIGNTEDWLRLVFTHEYTHIAHLSRAGGWIGGLRKGFGRMPLLFPNLYQPLSAIEGIATWQESARTREGRVPAGDFRLLLERAAAAGRFEPLDRTNGGNLDWPSGATPYLYGAYFHAYLAARYGEASVRRLADASARRLPYLGSRAYKEVYGRSLGGLWRDFEADVKSRSADAADTRATRLTHHGFNVSGPRYGSEGRIYYSAASPHDFPALMETRPGGAPRRIGKRFLGHRIGVLGEQLVVDEIEIERSVGLRSDLHVVDPRSGARRRLTRGARAADPDVSPDGTRVVCTMQMSDRRVVATFTMPSAGQEAAPAPLIDEPSTQFGAPRWSPDGRFIAAERRPLGRESEIVLIDPENRTVRVLARVAGGRSAAPAWMPDGGRVVFAAAVEGRPFRIHSVDVATGALAVLDGTGVSAQSPDVSPDGRDLVFVGYTADGYDLFSMPLADARWHPVAGTHQTVPPARSPVEDAATPPSSRRYSPWSTLAPRFWTPTLESDAGELVIGGATGALDALGRHAYGVEAGWSGRARPDWRAAYAYDRWRPTLFAAFSDDTDRWRRDTIRLREFDAGMVLRVSRVRVSHSSLAAFHLDRETSDCRVCPPDAVVDGQRRSLRLGWDFSNAHAYGYSISQEEGGRISATAELSRSELQTAGATARNAGRGAAFTLDARRYWRAGGRHAVLAVRAAAAGSLGDPEARRLFSAAGSGPQAAGFGFGHDAIGLLRGFGEDEVGGHRVAVVNIDYRVPLMRVDRGLGTVPVFVRSIHAAVFLDAGHAWTGPVHPSDLRVALGAELAIDTVLGFALPVTFTTGGAWRRDGVRGDRGFVAFSRIGRAF